MSSILPLYTYFFFPNRPSWRLSLLLCGAGPEPLISEVALLLAWWISLPLPPLDGRPDTTRTWQSRDDSANQCCHLAAERRPDFQQQLVYVRGLTSGTETGDDVPHTHMWERAGGGDSFKLFFYSSKPSYVWCCLAPDVPPAEPVCSAYVTNNQQYLMLSCSWDGGAPKALVWWEGPGGQSKGGKENSNILILRYGTAHSGLPYTCHAKHPLLDQTKTCRLTLGQCTRFRTLSKAHVLLIHSFSTSRGSCAANPAQSCVCVWRGWCAAHLQFESQLPSC